MIFLHLQGGPLGWSFYGPSRSPIPGLAAAFKIAPVSWVEGGPLWEALHLFPFFFRQLFPSPETTCLATDLMKFSKLTILSFSYFSSKTRSWRRCAVANSVESLFGTTCLKWDLGICGKTDGDLAWESSGRLPPRMVLYSQSKCDRHIQMSSAPWGHSTGLTLLQPTAQSQSHLSMGSVPLGCTIARVCFV